MQNYLQQQQVYGGNTGVPQQQQHVYAPSAANENYGSYYVPTNTNATAVGGGVSAGYEHGGNFMEQQRQQQQYRAYTDGYQQQAQAFSHYGQQGYLSNMNYNETNCDVNNNNNNNLNNTGNFTASSLPTLETELDPRSTGASAASYNYNIPCAAPNACDVNGLRWTWSIYPNTKSNFKDDTLSMGSIKLPEMIIPLACMYTPLSPIDTSRIVIGDPAAHCQQCPNCGSFWNKHCYREEGKFWLCFSCLRRNPMPPNYNLHHPALHHDTVEYILPSLLPEMRNDAAVNSDNKKITRGFPTYIFIIDTCLPVEELDALKHNLTRFLDWLPHESLVGLITFGSRVSVWELGNAIFSQCYSLRGEKQYEPEEVSTMLQISDAQPVTGRFLVKLEECEFTLTTLIDELQCDDRVTPGNKRPLRSTGTAVSVATRLLEALHEKSKTKSANVGTENVFKAGRLLLFTGGPCTRGPGSVVSIEKETMMRFHRDIIEGDTPFYDAAFKIYNDLQPRLLKVHACLDVFAESFDQVGILEMRKAVNQTGGTFVCGDTFNNQMFAISLQMYFDRCASCAKEPLRQSGEAQSSDFSVRSAFGVKFEVHTSADTLVCGVLGPCVTHEEAKKKKKVQRALSPIQIGVGDTTNWCVSAIDDAVTYTFVFDTATVNKKDNNNFADVKDQRGNEPRRRFIQFVTRFSTQNGEERVRVTSVALPIAPFLSQSSQSCVDPQFFVQHQTFDQTCAATVLARIVVHFLENHPSKWDDAKRWLDTILVRFVRRYGTFTPGLAESLRLSPCLSLFPSFIFNLRRSEYFMVLNISPDETTFKRHWLMREPVDRCVLMIQPTLHSYDLEAPVAQPTPLDSCSLRPDNILLMDAYFNIHVMWGSTIFAWIQANYHENPEYAHFAQLLNIVEDDAQALLAARYPYPRFSRTDVNGSEARHIKTRMNPTTTHHSGVGGAAVAERSDVIYTDEASIVKFMETLKKAVVSISTKSD